MKVLQTNKKNTYQITEDSVEIFNLENGFYRVSPTERGLFLHKERDLINTEVLLIDSEQAVNVYSEISNWIKKESHYKKYNYPFKRGFIFYGEPGNGKTKLIESVIQQLSKEKIIVFNIQNSDELSFTIDLFKEFDTTEHWLKDYLKIFILEDLEGIIEYESAETRLLQLLDGNIPISKSLFFATTNYLDRIKPRLWNRPSRFDRKIKINKPDHNTIVKYIKSFDLIESEINLILENVKDYTFAQIKEFIISYKILELPIDYIKQELSEFKIDDMIGFNRKNDLIRLEKIPFNGYTPTNA